MELILTSSHGQQYDLTIRSGNDSISFYVSPYLKLNKEVTEEELFKEANAFLKYSKPETREAVFAVYKELYNNFTDQSVSNPLLGDREHTREVMAEMLHRLYVAIDAEELEHWVKFHSDIQIPSSLNETYGPDDPRERTYLRSDYVDLIILTLSSRFLIPFFAIYIGAFASENGTQYKEYDAMRLLYKTWIPKHRATQRLLMFLTRSIEKEHESDSAILNGGLSIEELPTWTLGLAFVVRLPVARLTSPEVPEKGGRESTIISNVYYYIVRNVLNTLDRKFSGHVKDKIKPKETPVGDQDKSSIVDQYKTKQEVPEGTISMIKVFLENPVAVATLIASDIDRELVERCTALMMARTGRNFGTYHYVVTCWVLGDAVAPRGIESLHLEQTLLYAYSVCLAVLIHWGYYELAAMMLATVDNCEDEIMVTEPRVKMSKETIEDILALSPFYQKGTGVKANIDIEKIKRTNNAVVQDIDALVKECMSVLWFIDSDVSQLMSSYAPKDHPVFIYVQNKQRLTVPMNIKELLGRLAVTCMSLDY